MSRSLKSINKIIIHCSDSEFGDIQQIDQWHRARGWKGCGYHYVITNGIIHKKDNYDSRADGDLQAGRPLYCVGAHCKGYNKTSIGICLIGKHHFTGRQLYEALPPLVYSLMHMFNITSEDVYGHCEFSDKTCPNLNLKTLKKYVNLL